MTLTDKLQSSPPSRELDGAIAEAVFADTVHIGDGVVGPIDNDVLQEAPHFTTSIDAALTLLPSGFNAGIFVNTTSGIHGAEIVSSDSIHKGHGQTPALALCIAILKARGHND